MTAAERRLEAEGMRVPDLPRELRGVGEDDLLDACAVARSARRVALAARSLPDPPEVFSDGVPAAIWV